MPPINKEIRDLVAGDDVSLRITIEMPPSQELAEAWFTVKEDQSDLDADALFQKHLTTVDQNGVGQIEDVGSTGPGVVRVDIVNADSVKLVEGIECWYDLQVLTNLGKIYTPLRGRFVMANEITQATS